jgi:alkane 1-monooxygenase
MAAAFGGYFWMELLNFTEHYGLRRALGKDGIYESIGLMHAWSAPASPVMFRMQRHTDHHAHMFRPM